MEFSKLIVKDINEIYDKYKIPHFLREHLFRVASVSAMICDNWVGEKLNKDDLVLVGLLHDVGNVVKMDLHSENASKMLSKDDNLTNLRELQKEFIAKYGADDHDVTKALVREIGVSDRIKFLINNKEYKNADNVLKSSDFELKICLYADLRVSPFGVLSLKERLDDVKQRYSARNLMLKRYPKWDLWYSSAFEIEKEIFEKTSIKPEDVNNESIKKYYDFWTMR